MATFRGSNHQMAASSVWTNGDLANLIDNLFRQSIRAGAQGDYERGLRDMAQAIADATNTEIDLYPDGRYDLYNVNVHAGRPVEPYQAQPTLALADVEFHDFVPGSAVRRMEGGWMWLGNDGEKVFYPVQQWVELSAADARRIGYLIADNRTFVLAVRSMVEARLRRLGQSVRVLPNDRRLLP